jgi:hypothetical protein
VLGLFLTVTEGLLLYWLFRAENSVERAFIGLVMVLILLGLLYAVLLIKRAEAGTPPATMTVKPPQGEVSEREVRAPAPETMIGPDRSYLINRPPKGWTIRELTTSEWIRAGLGVRAAATAHASASPIAQARQILVLEREKPTSIIPIPGRTTIDGRKMPSALEILVSTQLSIIPIERAQPPLFIERSLDHNFPLLIGQILSTGALTARLLTSGTDPDTGRRNWAAELYQKINSCIINGQDGRDGTSAINVFGIQGEVRDYMLVIKYVAISEDTASEQDVGTLNTLVASFRPVKPTNVEEAKREIADQADKNFKESLVNNAQSIFTAELRILALRLKDADLNNPETLARTMTLFKLFQLSAKELGLQSDELNSLWEALHRAETGDAIDFKTRVAHVIQAMTEEKQSEDPKLSAQPLLAGSA